MNQNVKDALYLSVEEYNNTITDPKRKFKFERMSDDEKKGIFYNTLRRNLSFSNSFKLSRIENYNIILNEDGTIHSLSLKDLGYSYWGETVKPEMLLKQILDNRPPFEKTAAMNEIADIVNSIKIN